MRKLIALFTLAIVAGSCSEGGGLPRLEPLARGLSDAMQPAYADLRLEITAINEENRVTLHCVLRNVSIAGSARRPKDKFRSEFKRDERFPGDAG